MLKRLPLLIAALVALWPLASLIPPRDVEGQFAVHAFGSLPVLTSGREQPLDSLARTSLLQLRDKQTISGPAHLTATEWLMEMMMKPEAADTRAVFRIDHPQLKGLLGLPLEANPAEGLDGKNFSWLHVREKLALLQREYNRVARLKSSEKNSFDQAVDRLMTGVGIYMKLQNTLQPQNAHDWSAELRRFQENLPAAKAAARAQDEKKAFDQKALDRIMNDLERFETMGHFEPPFLIPPSEAGSQKTSWMSTSDALLRLAKGEPYSPALETYARMASAYQAGRIAEFNQVVADYRTALATENPEALRKTNAERYFNAFDPFYTAMSIYVLAGLLALVFWFAPARLDPLRQTAAWLVLVALLVHTTGIIFRMALEGRPPVTNLYSSAIFIGWGAVVFGSVIERIWRNSIGVVISSVIGFITLIIAHHLARLGDTMEMMRAVLDTNFWLATHVVVVTLGYASTFVAGFVAILYLYIRFVTRTMTPALGRTFASLIYGVVCFATLFSFVGTVLGGIWADQSWGRFWGWDPKENGALIIVLWNALVLHARWGGYARERGLVCLALVGNIVTSWSWFGVNMLGIGLHSYGFTDAAFRYLSIFILSQLALIALGLFNRPVAPPPSAGLPATSPAV